MDHVRSTFALQGLYTNLEPKTARVIEIATGATKAEFRGHSNVVENAIFVPRNAVPAIAELVGTKVRPHILTYT